MTEKPRGLAKLADAMAHPRVYAERATWKYKRFTHAFRKVFLQAPRWMRACNRRLEVLDYGPISIFLETASGCNLHCPMCPTGVGTVQRKHGFMSTDLARKLVAEIEHQPLQVGTWLGGEPLLHPDIVEIVRILADAGLLVSMHTNATLLNEEMSEALIDAGLGYISFSFDGADAAQYEKLRRGADFNKTLKNVRDFLRVKQEKSLERPWVTIQTVQDYLGEEVHPYGVELETPAEIRQLFAGLPVDEFKCIIAFGWPALLDDSPIVAPNHAHEGTRMACWIPYTDMVIAWDGRVVSCCGDLDALGVLGDFNRENLYELWNNENFQAFRRSMHTNEVETHPLCGKCERIWALPHRLDYELRLSLLRYRLKI
ncbi:MAG: radical SAM/SPASM domain-containing protein [Candidatus Sumerlaeia bacterium]